MSHRILKGRRWQHAAIVGGTAAAAAAIALPGAFAAGPPPPFFQHGTNGQPPPSNGSAMQVNEGLGGQGALLTSVGSGYGNVGVNGGDGTAKTFGGLTDVETEFNMTQGTCSGGAPRWVFNLSNPSNPKDTQQLIVYFDNESGNQPWGGCSPGTQQETNVINNPATGWFVSGSNTSEPYSQVESQYGSWTLKNVEIQLDGGWNQNQMHPNIQQVLLQNLKVNSASYFKIPS